MTTKREQAKARVEFRLHIYMFIAIMGFLVVLNYLTSPEYYWVKWPLLGWGIGLVAHGIYVYLLGADPNFKERMIEKEMDKLD